MADYVSGYVTSGSYFVYQGVRYGQYTQILFTEDFYKRVGEYIDPLKTNCTAIWCGWKYPYFKIFHSIEQRDGKMVWKLNKPKFTMFKPKEYLDIDPERDIEKIVTPVYYMEPKELVKKRLNDGTWINYIWPQTLFFVVCLLISPVLQQWYLIWTLGTYLYLRTSYITLSKGELNRGW